jgi:hypothetical protein
MKKTNQALEDLINKINKGGFPHEYEHFGGAELILTNEPDRHFHPGDTVVYSEHASALSWLVEELAKVYSSKIDHGSKYAFYPGVGKVMIELLKTNENLIDIMLGVIDATDKEWGNN